MRATFLLVLAGCAATDIAPPSAPNRLEGRIQASDAYASFHYVAELKDVKTSVRVELGWRARDDLARALEDSFRRWAIETDAGPRTIEALVAADVERLYEPSKMVAILK